MPIKSLATLVRQASQGTFVMASAFRPEYTFEENMERLGCFKVHLWAMGYDKKEVCVGCWEGEHKLSLKITVGGLDDACRISKIASVIYDQDAILYVDSHNEAHMMVYDTVINGSREDTIGEWKKVQSIDGLKGYTATNDGFYTVI